MLDGLSRSARAALLLAIGLAACSRSGDAPGAPAPPDPPQPSASPSPEPTASGTPAPSPGWVIERSEDFEHLSVPSAAWARDPVPDDGPFADGGSFFSSQGIVPPQAFRITQAIGDGDWLTLESYTRDSSTPLAALASVVPDPAGGPNRVLRIASPAHTDATVVRPSAALPARYRVSLRVGFASFGDGLPGLNGYSGGESGEPWSQGSAVGQNGFYWLTILDSVPRPHNNVWIHHHRKVVVDSDNNIPAFTEIWDGSAFVSNGSHPVMLFVLDGLGPVNDRTGPPFVSWSAGRWQPSGEIRAVDAYLPNEWYRVTLERFDSVFTVELSGRFRYGGERTYRASIDAAAACVFHVDRPGDDATRCGGADSPSGGWPDWFMFGDPHSNFYEGSVHFDDVRLEVWR